MLRFRKAETNFLVGRDVFIIAFFTEHLYTEAAPFVAKAFELWLEALPKDVLEWALVGPNATSYKPFTPAALARCRVELEPAKAAQKDLGYFKLRGGEDPNNPSYGFTFSGINKPSGYASESTCLVEIRWPSDFPGQFGFDALVNWVRQLSEVLPYRSAYASPALTQGFADYSHIVEGAQHFVPIALRHPGFDLQENEGTAAFMGKRKCRGARWLTLLGPDLIAELGGRAALQAKLEPGVSVITAGLGVLLRAGDRPELGDVNRGERALLLRSVAAAIEPVTFFNDDGSLDQLFDGDSDRVLKWERRNLD